MTTIIDQLAAALRALYQCAYIGAPEARAEMQAARKALAAYDARRAQRSAPANDHKMVPVCAQCGSANVSAEPTACRWDVQRQEWKMSDLCDDGHFCDDCDQEVDLTWRLATQDELKPAAPTCGHSACSQHFIDTGEGNCVQP